MPVGILVIGPTGSVTYANDAWRELSGHRKEQSIGDGWTTALAPADRPHARRALDRARRVEDPAPTEWRLRRPDGTARWTRWYVRRLGLAGDPASAVVVSVLDISEHRDLIERLRFAATHDPLTSTLSRPQFLVQVGHALAHLSRRQSSVAVIFVDLDHFKEVNDRHGHRVGDHALIAQAERLRRAVRPSDVVGRFGGDEFVVLCDELAHPEEAERIAARVQDELTAPLTLREDSLTVTVGASVGVAITTQAEASPEAMVDAADQAMYRAKDRGGGSVETSVFLDDPPPAPEPGARVGTLTPAAGEADAITLLRARITALEADVAGLWATRLDADDGGELATRCAQATRLLHQAGRALWAESLL